MEEPQCQGVESPYFCPLIQVTFQHHKESLIKAFRCVGFKKQNYRQQISNIVNHHSQSLVPSLPWVPSEEHTESSSRQPGLWLLPPTVLSVSFESIRKSKQRHLKKMPPLNFINVKLKIQLHST